MTNYLDLYTILPNVHPSYDWRSGEMARVEREVLSPALEDAGYRLRGDWYDGEKDSFGPLSRAINTDRGIVSYG